MSINKKINESLKFDNISIYTMDGRHNHYNNVVADCISDNWVAIKSRESNRVDMYNLNNVCTISMSKGEIQNE